MLWKKRSRLRNLRAQRLVLCVLLLFELGAAAMAFAFELASWISHQPGLYTRPPYGQESRFDHLVSISNSEFYFFPTFELYPLICLFLQISLLVFARRNRQNPVIGKEGIWTILLAVQLPAYCWWLTQASFVQDIAAVLVIASIIPLNIVLIRNLWQYTQAIRREKRGETGGAGALGKTGASAPAVLLCISPRELREQRRLLLISAIPEWIASIALLAGKLADRLVPAMLVRRSTEFILPLAQQEQIRLLDRLDSFLTIVFFPACLLIPLAVLLFFRQRNRQAPFLGRKTAWGIILLAELPAAAWWIDFIRDDLIGGPNPSVVIICFAAFLLNIFLIRNLRQYTRAIRQAESKEHTG